MSRANKEAATSDLKERRSLWCHRQRSSGNLHHIILKVDGFGSGIFEVKATVSPTPVLVGVDVACAKRKRLPICFTAVAGGRLEPLEVPDELAKRFPVGRGNNQIV